VTTRVRYAEVGEARIAFQVTGRGPLDLVLVPGFVSHLELDWEHPGAARLFERLGSFARLIRFDKRGTGLSDRAGGVPELGRRTDDVRAVLEAAGSESAALFAFSEGGPLGILFAATYPDRVSALALFDTQARALRAEGYPWGETWEERLEAAQRIEESWGVESELDDLAPGADDELRRWWALRQRGGSSPGAARALMLLNAQVDVRDALSAVQAPTLVLHRRGDRVAAVDEGRFIAERIRGARFVELPGDAHVPFVDPDQVVDEVEAFLTGVRPGRARAPAQRAEGRIGAYELLELAGRGGMGTVHVARDERLGRRVALKVIAPELATDERFRERFLREWKLAAALEHPNIVPIHDAGEEDGQLYIAMRYVQGTDLRTLLAGETTLEPARALRIMAQVAAALDAAAAQGLVHRDVKPANVLLDAHEHAYLCDFGLTKDVTSTGGLTATGQLVGTLDYVAPEQIRGAAVDARADQYALACVLYECLAGTPPFRRGSEAQTLWAHMQDDAPAVPGRPELGPVLARALGKEPDERYATCGDLVEDARRTLGLLPAQVAARRRFRLGRRLTLIGALLVVVAVAAIVVALLRGLATVPPTARVPTIVDVAFGVAERPAERA
jgi:pimeloyl-ACP methyl ester carboxylesterase